MKAFVAITCSTGRVTNCSTSCAVAPGHAVEATATELNLPPEILATRRDLEQLADGREDAAVMSGWRREVIGQRLRAAL